MGARRIVIIGAGFSGVLTAVHLLGNPGTSVTLIERAPAFGRGAAYSTENGDHLLNVRVGNMSAFPDDPDHLARWLAQRAGAADPERFIARGLYGDYLQDVLARAGGDRLRLAAGEAVDLRRQGDAWTVVLSDGEGVEGEAVVLALGNPEPPPPAGLDPRLVESGRYVADPWRGASRLPPAARRILLIGTGLTMVDVALGLAGDGRRLTALSRRGLSPRAHSSFPGGTPHAPGSGEAGAWRGSPAALLHRARRRARDQDWRTVMDEARHEARDIWRSWSAAERSRALRHLRPWWDVHRHRLAPAIAARVEALLADGRLELLAGRILTLEADGDEVALTWRPRGRSDELRQGFDAVINCTGPLADLARSREPLIRRLLSTGDASPDPLALGVRVDEDGRVLGADGRARPGLYAIGPLTRGTFWESTAVPDLRGLARDLAVVVTADRP